MLKKKALAYKSFVLEAEKAFEQIKILGENLNKKELSKLKRTYHPDEFENHYLDFEEELKENCMNYQNTAFIKSFLRNTFGDVCRNVIKKSGTVDAIIKNDFEVEFLLKLYEKINEAIETFEFFCGNTCDGAFKSLDGYLLDLSITESEDEQLKPDPRFVFENLKKEMDSSNMSVKERLETVQERLYDFLQWQKEFDTINTWVFDESDSKYEITRKLYPKFEDLCKLEIKRLENLLKVGDGQVPVKKKSSEIRVSSKKNTEVMKILSAMYDLKLFCDINGNPLTNKQKMMEAFGAFLNEDYSSYSTSLTQAKGRDFDNYLKIFDDLKKAGKQYLEK